MASYRLRIGWTNSYTLTAAGGSYALTGQAATLTKAAAPAGAGTISWPTIPDAVGYVVSWNTTDLGGAPYTYSKNVGNVTTVTLSTLTDDATSTPIGTGVRYMNVRSYNYANDPGTSTPLTGTWGTQFQVTI